jgi:hypothetical protein
MQGKTKPEGHRIAAVNYLNGHWASRRRAQPGPGAISAHRVQHPRSILLRDPTIVPVGRFVSLRGLPLRELDLLHGYLFPRHYIEQV